METQVVLPPPGNNGGCAVAGDYDDNIQEIGDQIANLTLVQAKNLADYLDTKVGPAEDDGLIACA